MEASLQGRQRNRLYRDFADGVADRGVHSAAVHVGTGRAHVPRIRADIDHRGRDVGDRVADADADDVLAAPEACRRGDCRFRAWPRSAASSTAWSSSIIARCCGCCERQRATMLVTFATHRRDADSVCRGAQGLPAVAGHGFDHGGDRGRSRRFLCRNAKPADPGGRRDQGRSGCHRRRLGDRRGFGQSDNQCRPPGDDAETARRAARRRFRRGRAPEANAWRRSRA